jgi:hypothetical protein
MRPQPRHTTDIFPGEFGHDRQHGGDRALGEQLLARQHSHDEADTVTKAGQQRLPRCIRQMRSQNGLRQ